MEATRARFGSAIEWVLAAACIIVAVAVVSIVVREVRTMTATMPQVSAHETSTADVLPVSVPARAVSVPVLLLPGKQEVRVGDTVSAVAARLGRDAEVGSQTVEQSRFGERLTRFYEHGGRRFVLVFEPFEAGGQPKVAAIFLQ